jgi:integrase
MSDSSTVARGTVQPPIGVTVRADVEKLANRRKPIRARVRWTDPSTGKRKSVSRSCATEESAWAWISEMQQAAAGGIDPAAATMTLADYGARNMTLALRGLEGKTTDPYVAGWRKRIVPSLGHLPVRMITYGAVDRAVVSWIADGCGRSTVKNSLAMLVRLMEQAVRDGLVDRNPARISGWQRQYKQTQDELNNPRELALRDWSSLTALAEALVQRSAGSHAVWGDVVMFAAATGARIGEVSGCRLQDVDTTEWTWTIRRQTTPGPGGLQDKGTKGRRARTVPLIVEIRELVLRRMGMTDGSPDSRLFTGPRGGRITTAVLRDATSWDEVVTSLGLEHLRRHDLRHTALTWFADAGVQVHHLQRIAGHGSLSTTQRYLHPSRQSISAAGEMLSRHLSATTGAHLRVV